MKADPADLTRRFYAARATGDLAAVRGFLAEDVLWQEPDVGDHMGLLRGPEAVLDMMRRAQQATGGSFRLAVAEILPTTTHCAALITWSAMRDGLPIAGRELVMLGWRHGRIVSAQFYPEDLTHDRAFWGEA
jgi:ketosteroid isomerase-like protein